MAIKTKPMSHKIFDNNLVVIRKSKVPLMLKKPAYIGMYILELSKVLMYVFLYNFIENKYGNNSKLLFTDTDGLMYEIKTDDVFKDFYSDKEMLDFSIYSTKSKYYDDSNKLVIGKMNDATGSVAIEEFVRLKSKMCSLLVDDNREHKNESNVVPTIRHNEYKDVLLNNECLRHSMNRSQSKDHKIETYEIDKILLTCFDDKIYIQNNTDDELVLGY